jgi:hypothetical protein
MRLTLGLHTIIIDFESASVFHDVFTSYRKRCTTHSLERMPTVFAVACRSGLDILEHLVRFIAFAERRDVVDGSPTVPGSDISFEPLHRIKSTHTPSGKLYLTHFVPGVVPRAGV